MGRLLLHAPNVHVGGGLVLLKELLLALTFEEGWANLDKRAFELLCLPPKMDCNFVSPSLMGRLQAEFRLRHVARHDDLILCFHGMPPLLRVAGRVVVFQQNRNYLGLSPLSSFLGRTKVRVALERFICRSFKNHVNEYIVQTSSMQSAVKAWHGGNPIVRVIPFMDILVVESVSCADARKYDFIYVADGEAHKNHRNLLAAWILLAKEGIFPSLALTLGDSYNSLRREIDNANSTHNLNITNLGLLPHKKVLDLYHSGKALIFPSTAESFGLPLLEASHTGMPIVASELDFVRDVCQPTQTFDPNSPVSIARAVKRLWNIPTEPIEIGSAHDFLEVLLK
ncbi:glycosyltransferase [Solimicrobium silvestre]|uniref:Glycosyl transferases group 1 n=1 Tax=Solimicrobium silvestre TaxID=2099400 RepID=A0A2S9GYA6_9BURK|nr:glycosyltransferase [Solimicrobium silvestre]PRC92707.1 Glycosyl transferases group 1 [Solimicrobium silvestre]